MLTEAVLLRAGSNSNGFTNEDKYAVVLVKPSGFADGRRQSQTALGGAGGMKTPRSNLQHGSTISPMTPA